MANNAKQKFREDFPYCAIPGCANPGTTHHIINKSAGGTNDRNNFITLCRHHHKLVHTGEIEISRYL